MKEEESILCQMDSVDYIFLYIEAKTHELIKGKKWLRTDLVRSDLVHFEDIQDYFNSL